MRDMLLPGSLVSPRQRAPLNFSGGWEYIKRGGEGRQTELVTDNREHVCTSGFNAERGTTQNNELINQID